VRRKNLSSEEEQVLSKKKIKHVASFKEGVKCYRQAKHQRLCSKWSVHISSHAHPSGARNGLGPLRDRLAPDLQEVAGTMYCNNTI
jgi:hypothetical protein